MDDEILHIYPQNFKEVSDRLIFFLDSGRLEESEMRQILSELQETKMLDITNLTKKEDGKWYYVAYLKHLSILFTEGTEQKCFVVSNMYQGSDFLERKQQAQKKNFYTIIPKGGIFVIYSQKMFPGDENADWNMKQEEYSDLTVSMSCYFTRPDAVSLIPETNHFHISDEFERRILRPYKECPAKEDWLLKNFERNNIESKYMYETFSSFTTGGYEKRKDDLAEFLAGSSSALAPPNQMQMEAIIKGIRTENMLLVLCPLGTGKSTIINQWVDYFVKNNQRVLVAANDNETVDHVLELFKNQTNEILRLGSEFAIQESCKKFLPKNKLEPFREAFQRNVSRVHEEREHNRKEIARYARELEVFISRLKIFSERELLWKENAKKISSCLTDIIATKQKITEETEKIDEIKLLLAHKKIFLDEFAAQKPSLQNKYRYQENRAKEDMKQSAIKLREHQAGYLLAIETYNQKVDRLMEVRDEVRTEGIMQDYYSAYQSVMELVSRMNSEEAPFFPTIRGEFSTLYSKPAWNEADPAANIPALMGDFKKLGELKEAMDKSESVLNDWEKAVNEKNESVYKSMLVRSSKIVGATCNNIKMDKDIQKARFDVAIMDEAGRIQLGNALIPMTMAKKNLMLGNFKQIYPNEFGPVPDIASEEELDEKIQNISLFEYLFESLRKVTEKKLVDSGKDESFFSRPVLMDYDEREGQRITKEGAELMIQQVVRDQKKTVVLTDAKTRRGDIAGAKHIF